SINKSNIIYLYNRSLLTRIESDQLYGRIDDPDYLLYTIHPALRNYVQNLANEAGLNLEHEYGEKFSEYYYNLLESTYYSIGKESHVPSLARFNIISQGKDNDFEKAIQLATNKQSAYILSDLGLISKE